MMMEYQRISKGIITMNKGKRQDIFGVSLRLDITIRPITPEDNDAIADVIRNSFIDNKIESSRRCKLHDPVLASLSNAYTSEKSGYWVATLMIKWLVALALHSFWGLVKSMAKCKSCTWINPCSVLVLEDV